MDFVIKDCPRNDLFKESLDYSIVPQTFDFSTLPKFGKFFPDDSGWMNHENSQHHRPDFINSTKTNDDYDVNLEKRFPVIEAQHGRNDFNVSGAWAVRQNAVWQNAVKTRQRIRTYIERLELKAETLFTYIRSPENSRKEEMSRNHRAELSDSGRIRSRLQRELEVYSMTSEQAFTKLKLTGIGPGKQVVNGPIHLHKHLPVLLNGRKASAIADRGCGSNLISMELAMQLAIQVQTDISCPTFQLPISNRKIKPVGRASMFVQFPNEPDTREVFEFFVCHDLDTPLILGRKFLKATETQTKYKHRLKDVTRHRLANYLPSLFSINDESETQERLLCHIDGSPFLARPDTGSAINVMSLLFAEQAGYHIDSSDQKLIRLGDGSVHLTYGTTQALVSLGDGSSPEETVEFDIVDELDVPIILGEQILLESDAFDKYADFFTEVDSDYLDFGSIVLIGKLEETIQTLKDKGKKAFTTIGKTKPAVVLSEVEELELRDNREYHRRKKEDARIAKLVGTERQKAEDAENWRREQFLRHRDGFKPGPVGSAASRVSSRPSSTSNNPSAVASIDGGGELSDEAVNYIALCA